MGSLSGASRLFHNIGLLNLIDRFPNVDCTEDTCKLLQFRVLPDGAPAHIGRTTMDYLKKEHINFIEARMWPTRSPDINPVDYAIWGALQQRVYHQRQFKTVE